MQTNNSDGQTIIINSPSNESNGMGIAGFIISNIVIIIIATVAGGIFALFS